MGGGGGGGGAPPPRAPPAPSPLDPPLQHEILKLREDVPGAILLREKPEECTSMCYPSSTSN